MHELALAKDIVSTVIDVADIKESEEIKAVYITVGEGRDIVPPLFRALFRRFAEGTMLEHAELNFNRKPMRVKCNNCGLVHPVDVRDRKTWGCPNCDSRNHELYSGMEFYIDYFEVA